MEVECTGDDCQLCNLKLQAYFPGMNVRDRKEIIQTLIKSKRFDLAQAMSRIGAADWNGPSPQDGGAEPPTDPRPSPWEDKIPGGRGDDLMPGDVDPKQLEMGVKVELEHSKNDPRLAKEIALDHLAEDPMYYSKLAKIDPHH